MLVLSDTGGPYAEFSRSFEEALDGRNWKIEFAGKPESTAFATRRPDLIVTAGSEAFRQTLAQTTTTPIVATLLPRLNYERILAESSKGRRRVTAIFLDQPAARQASFIRHLLPGQKRVGVLSSAETRPILAQYTQAFAQAGLSLEIEDSDTENALMPSLNLLLQRVNLLLALPDGSIYKRDNIRTLLLATYRHQRPVIGFSVALVNAGALAALHTTPAQIAKQASELILNSGNSLPPPAGPAQFAIAINSSVAQAMGLNVPDEAQVRRAMLADREAK